MNQIKLSLSNSTSKVQQPLPSVTKLFIRGKTFSNVNDCVDILLTLPSNEHQKNISFPIQSSMLFNNSEMFEVVAHIERTPLKCELPLKGFSVGLLSKFKEDDSSVDLFLEF